MKAFMNPVPKRIQFGKSEVRFKESGIRKHLLPFLKWLHSNNKISADERQGDQRGSVKDVKSIFHRRMGIPHALLLLEFL